ncbi:unnamed protein product [Bathycoccus prasinos]
MLRKLFGSSYGVYEGEDWMKIVNNSRFIVCPRDLLEVHLNYMKLLIYAELNEIQYDNLK